MFAAPGTSPDDTGTDLLPFIQELVAANKPVGANEWPPPPDPSRAGIYLINKYFELRAGVCGNGFGITPATWADIYYWLELSGIEFSPGQIKIIRQLDTIFITHANRKPGKPKPK